MPAQHLDLAYRHSGLPPESVVVRTRLRATIPGRYTEPPATAEMLYRPAVTGSTAGRLIVVTR